MRFVNFSKITWPLEKEEKSRQQKKNNQQHKQAACTTTRTERCAHRTAHFSSSEDSRSLSTAVYFNAFRPMRLILTELWLAKHMLKDGT